MVAILLLAVLVEFVISTALYERATQFSVRDDESRRIGEHLVIARRLLSEAPSARRPAMAQELSTDHYLVRWSHEPSPTSLQILSAMRAQVIAWEPGLALTDLRLHLVSVDGRAHVAGGVALGDGSWLHFRLQQPLDRAGWSLSRVYTAGLIAVIVMFLGALLVGSALRPMRQLAKAADRFGHGKPEHLVETGPEEVRQLIAAFNRMQERIARLIADRTQALAAAGHDLRTPLARLRLRADSVAQTELRETIGDDIAEMEAMIDSLLTYLGGETDAEVPTLTDLAVLCATLADDAADRGREVDYVGPDHCEIMVRPLGIKRAVTNLLENALHHAQHVRIILHPGDGSVIVAVEDDGPGIPEESLRQVLEPFTRLDTARRRDTVGLGLGLSIVVRAVAAEGGRLVLANRPTGGLRAEILLPKR